MNRWAAAGALVLLLAAGASAQRPPDWRRLASDADRARLRGWRATWIEALRQRPGALARDPALFDPDRALTDALPPLGRYRCRVHRLGGAGGATPPWLGCRIEDDKGRSRFVIEQGVQRAAGHFFPDTASRTVFLGTLLIGDERRVLRYGRDRQRDLAGTIERIGPERWRLILPGANFGSALDLIELVPA